MLLFISLFAVLFNLDYISYNETFLLGLFLIIFFYLIYIVAEMQFKKYIFFQIYKVFCLIFLVLKLSNFFQKLSIFTYIMKKRILKKIYLKTKAINKSLLGSINILFEDYLVIFCFLYFLNISKKLELLSNSLNILFIFAIDKAKRNDNILFFK
jgi:hypothetical protein